MDGGVPRRGRGWRLVRGGLAGRRRALVRMLAWSVVEALPSFLSGAVVARALDGGFLAGRPARGLAWLGVLAAATLLSALATRALYPALAAVVEGLRDHLVRTVVAATLYRAVAEAGRPDTAVVARLTEQVESVRRLSAALLRTLRQLAVAVVASVAGVTVLAPALGAVVAVPLAVALGLFGWLLRRLRARQRDLVLADEEVARRAGTVFGGVRDVVACRARHRAAADVDAAVDGQARAARALARAAGARSLVVALGGQGPLVAALAVGPWLVGSGRLTAGELVGAVTYVAVSLQPALRSLVHTVGSWGLQLDVVLARLAETCDPPAGAAGAAGAGGPARTGGGGAGSGAGAGYRPRRHDLRAVSLTFGYGGRSLPVVDGLDLSVGEGEHLAVVGVSGTGKSTLAALLTGLVPPQRGRVLLGGLPVDRLDPAELRRAVAFVPQEAYVFAGTVRENLTYLRPGATDADLDAAVAALGLRPLVARLGGYPGRVDPAALSGGERQALTLARAYLSPARVVVLDEASSLLDQPAEERVERAFSTRPVTLVVVAHRMSSALRADRVLLLDGGRAWSGSHEEMLSGCPRYAELFAFWQSTTVGPARPSDPPRSCTNGHLPPHRP